MSASFDVEVGVPDQKAPLVSSGEALSYPYILPIWWRVTYIVLYFGGAVIMIAGSYQYVPGRENLLVGGIIFTVGSFGYVVVDLMEWWTNARVGCFHYSRYEESFELQYGSTFAPRDEIASRFYRAESGLIAFHAFLGSLLYQIGSIMFIPELGLTYLGTWLFIIGSAWLTLSQVWRIHKDGRKNRGNLIDKTFRWSNMVMHPLSFAIHIFCLLATVAYFVGSIYFLPYFDKNVQRGYEAAVYFIVGSCMDTIAALLIFYRFFFTEHFTLDP
ncbi:hypothetical protein B484DRAFT_459319 [Ochromonadaceae sp. CCMP2298]|nr:hypothetical protein B484DRAFT_459319 [Ochromonadaceae sp. CCMP2298]|mmetsp:Transcript_21342/g.47411  ORF Transcript_21342/g.47411 Transcript_21342/m.47411 type:complete len:272 (-) Transcript_21342:99-914(-)